MAIAELMELKKIHKDLQEIRDLLKKLTEQLAAHK